MALNERTVLCFEGQYFGLNTIAYFVHSPILQFESKRIEKIKCKGGEFDIKFLKELQNL